MDTGHLTSSYVAMVTGNFLQAIAIAKRLAVHKRVYLGHFLLLFLSTSPRLSLLLAQVVLFKKLAFFLLSHVEMVDLEEVHLQGLQSLTEPDLLLNWTF